MKRKDLQRSPRKVSMTRSTALQRRVTARELEILKQ